jgi:NADPH2:quinone reductase
MKAAWYERQGAARDVLRVGEMDGPQLLAGEVRIRIAFSGVNPGDVKKREDAFGVGMPHRRVIPHSDGSGTVDAVGEGVPREWIGRRVWCYGAQSYRPFGTAAEYTVVPLKQVVQLPNGLPLEQGACLGIPGITAHRAVTVGGSVEGLTVLVQGGAGAVGACAVQLAHQAGARVIATCRTESDRDIARRAGADEVLPRMQIWRKESGRWLPMACITLLKWRSRQTSKPTWKCWRRTPPSRPTQPMLRGRRLRSGNWCS